MINNSNHSAGQAPGISSPPADLRGIVAELKSVNLEKTGAREIYSPVSGEPDFIAALDFTEVADALDLFAPGWSSIIGNIQQFGGFVTVTVGLSIAGTRREGIGIGAADSEYGIKNAEQNALIAAAVKFGLGREIYRRESAIIAGRGAVPAAETLFVRPANLRATGPADLCTAKQIGMMKSVARSLGIALDEECDKFYPGIKTDELSKRAASGLIKHLQDLESRYEAEHHFNQPPNIAESSSEPANPENAPAAVGGESVSNVTDIKSKNLTLEEKQSVERWREAIQLKLGSCGINHAPFLTHFDSRCHTFEMKKAYYETAMRKVLEMRRDQIKRALADQPWDASEIEGELLCFGIENGLDSASFKTIEAMWTKYKETKMISFAKK